MLDRVYRVAIVGLGRMGSTIDDELPPGTPPMAVAAACRLSPFLAVVAGADIDPAKRAAFQARWGVDALYEDYLEMIRQEEPDLVAICTRGPLHAEMTVGAAEAGAKMIFCEKAMACSMEEADAALAAVSSRGIPFNTGVLRRFNRVYHQARDLIADGAIGEPRTAVHYAGTNLLHGHIHSLDTLSFLLGDPGIVSVWGELLPRELSLDQNRLDSDPNAVYRVEFANGVEATTVPAGTWEFEVLGSRGSVRVLNNGERVLLRQAGDARGRTLREVPVPPVSPHSATQFCLEDLVDAYETGRPSLGNVQLTHHLTEACLAVAESHRQGSRVTLPLANRSLYIHHV